MFDPSKLNLDLEENNNNEKSLKKEENKVINEIEKQETETSKQENIETKKEESNNEKNLESEDILGNLNVSEEIIEENNSNIIQNQNKEIENNSTKEDENIKDEIKEDKKDEEIIEEKAEEDENKIIFDINITSVDIILKILIDNEYDFATFETSEEEVKISFRKDKVIKDVRYIKYPIYTNILLKAKALSKLTIEETENTQEWEWEVIIKNTNYKLKTKVVPSAFGSNLFIKAIKTEKKVEKKIKKKTSMSEIFTFLGAILFIALIIWWAFIWFVVLNAKTVEDVKFFYSLWINLNDINTFISQAIAVIFSILIFIETIFLISYLFKFFLTKKEFKQKKIRYWIIASIVLIITFSTASAWMIIDKKIRALPNWQEMAYWDIQLYDNYKLKSDAFSKEWALYQDTSNLIWPVEIKFDLSFFAKKEEQKGFTIEKYIWDFWNDEIVETPTPTIIRQFNKKWNNEIKLTIQEVDLQDNVIEKAVENIPDINISYVVNINETPLNSWGKLVDFDATNLSELWKIEWYFMDDLNNPIWTWENFKVWKPIFEETLVWMYIRSNDKETEELDKLFIIDWESETNLDWKIEYSRWIINDLEFEFKLTDLNNDFWNWYIEEYKWKIWTKEITKAWDIQNPEEASKISYTFESYWEHEVSVTIVNSAWESKTISETIDVPKNLKIAQELRIYNNSILIEDVQYDDQLNEYYINELWIPTSLKLDARFVKSDNLLYTLTKVDWDYDSDWDLDDSWKVWNYDINIEWNHTITVYYEFTHRKIEDDIIKIKEEIFVEAIKKEAIINFDISKNSDYVPVTVAFDASKSQVKDQNIEKFIWDYGDWITEERDAIVPWHKYSEAWDYEIKLTVVTSSWNKYSTTKKLILKPKPQIVKISTSMKKAPIWQWIDFSSDDSEWQIVWYFWDFWDWKTSTQANPTHNFLKAWTYTVTLKLDFANKNIAEDSIKIEIVED